MDYKDKKVVIMGLGNYEKGSGISAALFFIREGANLLITDLRTEKDLAPQLKKLKKYKNIKYVLGRHRKKDFKSADFVFKNPGVPKNSPHIEESRKNKIPIINDWSIYFEKRPNNLLIGVTGTKGKSVTTTLIYEILKGAGKDAVLCGNIGQSPLAILDKIKPNTIVVAELSSWLLQEFRHSPSTSINKARYKSLRVNPQISVITNLMADHLDKYKSLAEYHRDKENIFRFQNKEDYLLLNKNDPKLQKISKKAKSKILWFSDKKKHDAVIVLGKLLKIPSGIVQKTIKNFKGVPGRLEFIKEKNGIRYYNDTCATMPEATIYALHTLKECEGKIILIAGGVDKKLDYKELVKEIPKYCKALVLFRGSAGEKITTCLEQNQKKNLEIRNDITSMKLAISEAKKFAKKGDIILLSPAAASFNLFKNEHDRGQQFTKRI